METVTTRMSADGGEEVVALPEGIGFGAGTKLRAEREAGRIVLTPIRDPADEKRRWLAFLDDLAALPKPPTVEVREGFDFPDRPGL